MLHVSELSQICSWRRSCNVFKLQQTTFSLDRNIESTSRSHVSLIWACNRAVEPADECCSHCIDLYQGHLTSNARAHSHSERKTVHIPISDRRIEGQNHKLTVSCALMPHLLLIPANALDGIVLVLRPILRNDQSDGQRGRWRSQQYLPEGSVHQLQGPMGAQGEETDPEIIENSSIKYKFWFFTQLTILYVKPYIYYPKDSVSPVFTLFVKL